MALVSSLTDKCLIVYFNFELVTTVPSKPRVFDHMGKKRVRLYVSMFLLLAQNITCLYEPFETSFFVVCVLFLARQPPEDQGLIIHDVSRSHTITYNIQ